MEPVIDVTSLSVQYGSQGIIHNLSLTVQAGEFCYLTGDTGSGKSTLFKVLYGDCPFQQGRVMVCGTDMGTIKHSQMYLLRRRIGIVFDDFQLFQHKTVFDNLVFVLDATDIRDKAEQKKRIENVLTQTGMLQKVYTECYKLSAGEQHKVAIARALLNNPALILADEPTGNLDPRASLEIVKLLQNLAVADNIAIIMATHDMAVVDAHPARQFTIS